MLEAAEATGGLVKATLLGEIEAAGYATDLPASLPLELVLVSPRDAGSRTRTPAGATSPWTSWEVAPPGLGFDSGSMAKGLFADLLAAARGARQLGAELGKDLHRPGARRASVRESISDQRCRRDWNFLKMAVCTPSRSASASSADRQVAAVPGSTTATEDARVRARR